MVGVFIKGMSECFGYKGFASAPYNTVVLIFYKSRR